MLKLNRRNFLQASGATVLLNRFNVSASPAGLVEAEASAFVRTNSEGESWTVGNALVEREVHFDPKLGLYTSSWRHKVTGTDFIESARRRARQGSEFSVSVDEVSLAGSSGGDWEFVSARTEKLTRSGECLTIQLRAKAKPLELALFYAVYDAHPVVQKWIAITNRGTSPVTLSHLSFESVTLRPGAPERVAGIGVLRLPAAGSILHWQG